MSKVKSSDRTKTRDQLFDPMTVTRLKPVDLKAKLKYTDKTIPGPKIRFASLPLKIPLDKSAGNISNRVADTEDPKPKQFQIKTKADKSSTANGRIIKFQIRANSRLLQDLSKNITPSNISCKDKMTSRPVLARSMAENSSIINFSSVAIVSTSQFISKPATCASMTSVTQTENKGNTVVRKRKSKVSSKKMKRVNTADKILAPANVVYYFRVKKGNNHEMIERIISNRTWWKKEPSIKKQAATKSACNVQFQWWMVNRSLNFCSSKIAHESYLTKKSCNRFSHAFELSDKDNLLRNLWYYGQRTKTDIFQHIPLTFSFRMKEHHFTEDIQDFARLFLAEERGVAIEEIVPIKMIFSEEIQKELPIYYEFNCKFPVPCKVERKYKNPVYSQIEKTSEFFNGKNFWILKPSGCDRGKGVEIVRSLDELNSFLSMYVEGYNMSEYVKMNYDDDDVVSPSMKEGAMVDGLARRTLISKFVIQKYMERPALFKGYKFDIRAHAMFTQDNSLYVFRNSFVRICSLPYDLDKNNYFGHLCNTSVNMKSNNFGNLVIGNQMSIIELADFFDEKEAGNPNVAIKAFEPYLFDQITKLVKLAFDSCMSKKNLLNPQDIANTFELFGFDVMVDEAYRCWLIEANFVPGLTDEDSPYLKSYLDRMMDDLFKLTLDAMYPMPKNATRTVQSYPFLDHPVDENLWMFVCKY
jgi:Tubulin-tyrosine ligase family